jgi:sarcosine oxidase subunit delta
MKILTCPINGPRPVQEFSYGGEYTKMPDPGEATDGEWADYVFNRNGAAATKIEWWCHTASGVWFLAERDTQRDEIVRTLLHEEMTP